MTAPLDHAWNYPLFEALYRRRSRRFGLGFEMQEGPFRYKSAHAPVPLTELEEALLVGAGAGFTGLAFWDLPTPPPYPRLSGRTFPTTRAGGHTALFLTNDKGFMSSTTRSRPASCARSRPGRSAASFSTSTALSVERLSPVGSTFPAACRR
jgi:hypothetical protein